MFTRRLPPDVPADLPRWIQRQLVHRGIHDAAVLRAFARVPREAFVPPDRRRLAYDDGPVPIGCGQTLSQPYVIAETLQALRLTGAEKVLEVGTGSGYQTVLLSWLAREVYSIEYHQELYISARTTIQQHARGTVHTRHGDGREGWPEVAPFDAIAAGCFARRPPEALVAQLAPGGRMVLPVGSAHGQVLSLYEKGADGALSRTPLGHVMFVPMLGEEPRRRGSR